jgi:hypothetical protein
MARLPCTQWGSMRLIKATLGRQPAGDHLNAFFPFTLRLQGALILLLDPGLDVLTDMKGGRYPRSARACVALERQLEGLATPESWWSPD